MFEAANIAGTVSWASEAHKHQIRPQVTQGMLHEPLNQNT